MNYTPEITEEIVKSYKSGQTVHDLALHYNVPPRSIIAKLSQLGVYSKKIYLSKTGEVPIKKEQLVEQIAVLIGEDLEKIESLEKCNKRVLQLLITHLS